MVKDSFNNEVDKPFGDVMVEIDVPSIGTGRMVPVATHIVLMLGALEHDQSSRLMVLSSVLEHVRITPEDLLKYDRNGERHLKGDWNNDEPYSWEVQNNG